MADKKITELTALVTAAPTDLAVVVSSPATVPVTRKITIDGLKNSIASSTRQANVIPIVDSTSYIDSWCRNTGWTLDSKTWTYAK